MVKKPSQRLADVLSGKVRLEDEDASIRSWCQFFIYQGAEAVLKKRTKEERRTALNKIPENVRPHVEAEVLRLWNLRRG